MPTIPILTWNLNDVSTTNLAKDPIQNPTAQPVDGPIDDPIDGSISEDPLNESVGELPKSVRIELAY